jgi:hypothetical protein
MKETLSLVGRLAVVLCFTLLGLGCARTEIVESPKTAFVSDAEEAREPEIIWSSRTLVRPFDYLGQVKVRAWTYDAALDRLKDGGRQMKADAVIDVHFERVGFLKTMQAFAVKFKK